LDAAFDEDLWRLAWPFFLPVLVTIASLRWLISTKLSQAERLIAYLVSAISICVTLSGYATHLEWPNEFKAWLGFLFPLVTLGFGIFALLKTRQIVILYPFRAIMSMQIAYMANCLLCLSSFFGLWMIGAYCSLLTVVAFLIQIILVWRNDVTDSDTRQV
jgi:hypothetical protein